MIKRWYLYTIWLMSVTAVIWISYDVMVYIKAGNAATESASIWRYSYIIPGIPYLSGILFGHFFFQMRAPSKLVVVTSTLFQYIRLGVLLISFSWLGLDIYLNNKYGVVTKFSTLLWSCTYHQVGLVAVLGIITGFLLYQMDEATEPA